MITVHFDGACWPKNPGGRCTWGYVIRKGEYIVHTESGEYVPKIKGRTSNNLAEYAGLCAALAYLKYYCYDLDEQIEVMGDSKLVINQMSGKWRIKNGIYRDLAVKAKYLKKPFKNIKFKWIRREQNSFADSLSKKDYAIF